MSEPTQSSFDQIIVAIDQLGRLARAMASLEGQESQAAVLANLQRQYTMLGGLLECVVTSASDNIRVGAISNSSGVAVGAGAQSTVRNVNTAGGDYAEGQLDKRSGVFVSGGEIKGPVVGTNSGTISTNTTDD